MYLQEETHKTLLSGMLKIIVIGGLNGYSKRERETSRPYGVNLEGRQGLAAYGNLPAYEGALRPIQDLAAV